MRTQAVKDAIEIANAVEHPIANCVKTSIEVGVIIPSVLKTTLAKAGYAVNFRPGDVVTWCLVTHDNATEYDENSLNIVARACSENEQEALLQAVYGVLKEIRTAAAPATV